MTTHDVSALEQTPEQPQISAATHADALKRIDETTKLLNAAKTKTAIHDLIREYEWAGPQAERDAAKLLTHQFKLEGEGLTVTDEKGNPIMGSHGLCTPAELVERFRAENQHFTKQANTPAAKPAENPLTTDAHLRRLFGKQSDSKYAQKFVNERGIAAYRKLKAVAIERGGII